MELRIALNPADLDRFRSHSILKTFKRGRPRNSIERTATPTEKRLAYSVYELGGNAWTAEMTLCHGQQAGQPVCTAQFRLREGPSAPLCALLQAMAEAVPFRVMDEFSHTTKAVKAKPPPLQRELEAGEAFRLIAASAISHLLVNGDYLSRTADPEAVHQMRVAVRRLRAAMTMFKPLLGDPVSGSLRGELRWLQQTLGAARDWDVLLADTVAPLKDLFGEVPGYGKLCAAIDRRRQEARTGALKELDAPRLTRLMLLLTFWAENAGSGQALSEHPVAKLARAILDKRYRKIRKKMVQLNELSADERHECRIDVKKLRYAMDFFSSLFPAKHSSRLLPLLASMQDKLGALNDLHTAQDKLGKLVLEQGDADMAWAAGQLLGWHAGRSPKLLSQVQDDWSGVERLPAFWKED